MKAPANPARRRGKARRGKKTGVVLLAGGNPQIAKADGDAPVQAYIAAMPGWKRAVGRRLDQAAVAGEHVANGLADDVLVVGQKDAPTLEDRIAAELRTGPGENHAGRGLDEFLAELRSRALPVGLASSSPRRWVDAVLERFHAHTFLRVILETGRTHQIRVHLAHVRHPVVGDPVYGRRRLIPGGVSAALREAVMSFPRQALHASDLALEHPLTGEALKWSVPLPADMQRLLDLLRSEHAGGGR